MVKGVYDMRQMGQLPPPLWDCKSLLPHLPLVSLAFERRTIFILPTPVNCQINALGWAYLRPDRKMFKAKVVPF